MLFLKMKISPERPSSPETFLSNRKAVFKQTLARFVVTNKIKDIVAFGVEYSGWHPVS